jgi:hypothetical protein
VLLSARIVTLTPCTEYFAYSMWKTGLPERRKDVYGSQPSLLSMDAHSSLTAKCTYFDALRSSSSEFLRPVAIPYLAASLDNCWMYEIVSPSVRD